MFPCQCKKCKVELIGDYYANNKHTLCRRCYSQMTSATGGDVVNGDVDEESKTITEDAMSSAEDAPEGDSSNETKEDDDDDDRDSRHSSGGTDVLNICLTNMTKIRDCSSIHRHEFPGTTPKTIVS